MYPEGNEALVHAGVTALSRETSSAYPGFGVMIYRPGLGRGVHVAGAWDPGPDKEAE